MGSALYEQLVSTAGAYIGEDRARRSIDRQLDRCQATPETFNEAHLRSIVNFVVGATTLPLYPDKDRVKELSNKINALV